ncbi:beta-alanine-activating enzyme isoform X2 [Salarias fasciatus]|uniref:beta-alanine-activating enzyme isoform X2 n=1 Tax=Salarias fasciatus TaxID=181472 RepID=UPI001176C82A|nr:beta-alanine-activating enzyme isoform X2 [Salarias fasciatus]
MSARTLQELVSAAASLHPDRVAVTFAGDSQPGIPVSLSYRQLDELSGELSKSLLDNCSQSGGGIGLYCGEDVLTPVWILGILQSDAAYVPLDPEADGNLYATVRNLKYCAVASHLLQQFKTALFNHVTVDVFLELPKFKLTLVRIKRLQQGQNNPGQPKPTGDLAGGSRSTELEKGFKHRDLAYVLHTSGTTGFPKTVRVPHKCILPNILHLRSLFQMSADDVVFLASPLTFDPSVVDIFLALSSGARLLIVPAVIKKMPNKLAQLLFKDHKTSVLQVTPTLLLRFGHRVLKEVVLSSGSSLRVLALGGEVCPSPALLRSWRHQDNETHIYNIYGVTEVSCWASCYRIPPSLLSSSSRLSSVPLGTPLTDTVVEVRGEDGCLVTDGEGQVFIGGEDRVCLLGDEDKLVPGTMRATGDWVKVEDAHMFYLGRRDRMIKRHGKRVNLDGVQQVMLSLPQVESCAVALHRGFRLIAFVVAAPISSRQQRAEADQENLPSSGRHHLEEAGAAEDHLKEVMVRQLSALLPSHSVPDVLLLVPALSLNPHGKVDLKALMEIYERERWTPEASPGDAGELKQRLQALWQKTLGLPGEASVNEESNFLFSGGDSLKALSLTDDIFTAFGASSPHILEVILDGTFSDVLRLVTGVTRRENSSPSEPRKRPADPLSATRTKRERRDSTETQKLGFKVVRRAGDMMEFNIREGEVNSNVHPETARTGNSSMGLSLSWSSDTGKCVDASPVLLVRGGTGQGTDAARATVFIGSHSHRVQALALSDGSLLWERVLGDRIEASAAVSHCGTLVILGCYDGCVYFLCAESGETRWTFETGDAVKSSPAVDPHTGLVIVGSHDGHVYALNPQVGQCIWKRHCGGGAVFASPRLHPAHRRLYVASLGGRLLCLNLDTGDVLWSHCRNVPFFSSPNCCSEHVVIGSVDGNICCFDSSGKRRWQFLTEGPVFSSPCFTPDRQRLLCGSHDGRLYCLDGSDGALLWSFQTTGKVYGSPCVLDGPAAGRRGLLVGLASTDGTVWVLDGRDGRMLAAHRLPGELFSSPVAWGRSLVVGCRDDYVYCLKLQHEDN